MNPHLALDKLLNWLVNHSLQAGVLVVLVGAGGAMGLSQKTECPVAVCAVVDRAGAAALLPFNPESALRPNRPVAYFKCKKSWRPI